MVISQPWLTGGLLCISEVPRSLKHTLISLCLETLKLDEYKNKFKNEGKTHKTLRTEKLVWLSLEIPFCTPSSSLLQKLLVSSGYLLKFLLFCPNHSKHQQYIQINGTFHATCFILFYRVPIKGLFVLFCFVLPPSIPQLQRNPIL